VVAISDDTPRGAEADYYTFCAVLLCCAVTANGLHRGEAAGEARRIIVTFSLYCNLHWRSRRTEPKKKFEIPILIKLVFFYVEIPADREIVISL
jgi:hypothetical protein